MESIDLFNNLPEPLLCHILSFLSTKEAASTSVLSKRWRYLLAFVPNLEFDDSDYLFPEKRIQNPLKGIPGIHPCFRVVIGDKLLKLSTSFPDFVDRILALQDKYPIQKLFLKLVDGHDPVDSDSVTPWIHNVLERGLSDLHLVLDNSYVILPPRIFLNETLVRLRIEIQNCNPEIHVENVHLPKLKHLHLESVDFIKEGTGFRKLLSGCPVLEELILDNICPRDWRFISISVTTLKRLTFCCSDAERYDNNTYKVSINTPNLVYLEYTEVVADKYPKVKFDSLVKAKIDLLKPDWKDDEDEEVHNIVSDATDFMMGIKNVEMLYLSANTLEVLTFCCKAIPIFNNLTHLTIESKPEVGWESLPGLLKNCPELETLVFKGLHHNAMDIVSCLSSSHVKVLKVFMDGDDKVEHVKHFLETMSKLERLVVHYDPSFGEDVKVSSQFQMLNDAASPKCKVQLIPDKWRVTVTYPKIETEEEYLAYLSGLI